MDHQAFDRIARLLGATTTRRAGLRSALAAAGFSVVAGDDVPAGAAKGSGRAGKGHGDGRDRDKNHGRPKPAGPCGDGSIRDNRCTKDSQCCTGLCNTRLARRNKDGQGRCRCVNKGRPCTEDRNCCGARACTNGVCGGARPMVATGAPCTPEDICRDSIAVCTTHLTDPGGGTFCLLPDRALCTNASDCEANVCTNGTCNGAAPLVPTGDPCVPSDECRDKDASCVAYDSGDPAGTFCLLPRAALCDASDDCASHNCIGGVCVACSHPSCSQACTPTVCATCTYQTVQAAIDNAAASDVIVIGAGRYVEDLTIDKDLVLRACPGDTVILRNATGSTTSGNASRTITVTGGKLDIVGIIVDGTGDRLSNPKVYGGGIKTDSDLGLYGNTVIRNAYFLWQQGAGGAMVSGDNLQVTVTDNVVFEQNTTDTYGAGLYVMGESDVTINGSAIFRNNWCDYYGSAIFAGGGANLTVTDNVQVIDNTGQSGGGIAFINWTATRPTTGTISGNVLCRNNRATNDQGGGIILYGNGPTNRATVTITDNVRILDNQARKIGGGIMAWDTDLTIDGDVVIAGNSSDSYGGGIYYGSRELGPTMTIGGNVVIRDNAAAISGGGIDLHDGVATLTGSAIVSDNRSDQDGGGCSLRYNTLRARAGSLTVETGALITRNTAANQGGGVYSNHNGNTLTAATGTVVDNTPDNCAGNAISC